MNDRVLSNVASTMVGVSIVATFARNLTATASLAWLLVAGASALAIASAISIPFPDASILGKSLGSGERPRWLTVPLLVLATVTFLLSFALP